MPNVKSSPTDAVLTSPGVDQAHVCAHCQDPCPDDRVQLDGQFFCCEGCKTVYEILHDNGLCRYYQIDENAGISLKGKAQAIYAYLDDPKVIDRLIDFQDTTCQKVSFYLPQIHCASCIWLLENLYKLNPGITESRVNFLKKEIFLTYRTADTNLRRVVELLASIGYAPSINLADLDRDHRPVVDRPFFFKLGVAGFAFGNIMLLSFPEYLGLEAQIDAQFYRLFGYLNLFLSIPVVFYSGRDYLTSAWTGLRQRELTIDVPIALGMLTLFLRSAYEILSQTGPGFMDSLAGLVFFLLVGKWFQQRTYHNISFERDYKSYFPISALRRQEGQEEVVALDRLEPGDTIIIRNGELIPADAYLMRGVGRIDYSFVTGESQPVPIQVGEKIFAGGRQEGTTIELNLVKQVSQSYLTQLWNDDAFTKKRTTRAARLADTIGKYFTMVILTIAAATLAYWLPRDVHIAVNAFTAVLIIACPCAVALSIPFIFGNGLRVLGKRGFYLKNTGVIEGLARSQAVVFDKTGTITTRADSTVAFEGAPLSELEKQILLRLTQSSAHPASQLIHRQLNQEIGNGELPEWCQVNDWKEIVGKGVAATICQKQIKLGSRHFMDQPVAGDGPSKSVYLQINGELRGCFQLGHFFREGLWEIISEFQQDKSVYLLSGDNEREKDLIAPIFGGSQNLHFQQSPHDKLRFIKDLQSKQKEVIMIGDGLNDAGALKQSDVGVVVAEDTNNFTPASDAILRSDQFGRLTQFIRFAKGSIRLVFAAYALAFIYNTIGLSFAVQGTLSPVIAAILMPLSSITIVLFGTFSSSMLARRMGLHRV